MENKLYRYHSSTSVDPSVVGVNNAYMHIELGFLRILTQ